MITGKFMTSNDDIEKVLEIRGKVFPGSGTRDEIDTLAIYALTFSEDGQPGSSGRLFMDDDNVVTIDLVGTVPELRCQGLGDLVMRMLLYRVLEMELPMVKLDAPAELVPFFARYGLKPTDAQSDGLVRMAAPNAEINIEGTCKHCPGAQ